MKHRYAAAKVDRLNPYINTESDINKLLSYATPIVRSRVRQLVRDLPFFNKAVNVLLDHIIGEGWVFQSKAVDVTTRGKIEDVFNQWAESVDVADSMNFNDLLALCKRTELECGEYFLLKQYKVNKKSLIPYKLLPIDPDRVSSNTTTEKIGKGNLYTNGREYDPQTGEIIAYHISDDGYSSKTIRVLRQNVIHGYDILRPGQIMGISPFVSSVLVSQDLQDYLDAEIDAARMAAKWVGSIETTDPYGKYESEQEIDGERQLVLDNAIIELLRPGEKLNLTTNPRPNSNFTAFVRLVLTMMSVGVCVPYELMSGDYTGMNYTVSRMSRLDFHRHLKVMIRKLQTQCANKIARDVIDIAVLRGVLSLPNYFNDKMTYQRIHWGVPGIEFVDPLKESKANIDQLKNGLKSPQEIVAARGRELEDVLQEIAIAKEMAQKIGINLYNEEDK